MAHMLKVLRLRWGDEFEEKKFTISQQTDVAKTLLSVGLKLNDESLRRKTAGALDKLLAQLAAERKKAN